MAYSSSSSSSIPSHQHPAAAAKRNPLPPIPGLFLVLYEWDGSMGGSVRCCCCCGNFRIEGWWCSKGDVGPGEEREASVCVCSNDTMETNASHLLSGKIVFLPPSLVLSSKKIHHDVLFHSHSQRHPGSYFQYPSHIPSSSPSPFMEGLHCVLYTQSPPPSGGTGDGSTLLLQSPTSIHSCFDIPSRSHMTKKKKKEIVGLPTTHFNASVPPLSLS